jgi:hypothetical protein
MAQYEITLTAVIDASSDAEAEKQRAAVQKLAPMAKVLLKQQGVKVVGDIVVNKPKVKP